MVWVRKVAGGAPLLLPLRTEIGAEEKKEESSDQSYETMVTHISKTRAAL